MHFVLILISALTVYAQAAPQFNLFNPRNWRSGGAHRQDEGHYRNSENHNRKIDVTRQDFTSQSNDYGRQTYQNYQGSSDKCWDPVDQSYRDRQSQPQQTHHPEEFYNDDYPVQSNYNPSMYRNPYPEDQYHGQQRGRFEPQPSPYYRGHGPPQHHHNHHQHRPPPHNHHHHHGPPAEHHGYGHPPHYHQHGLPPRPPRPNHNGNEYELELCEEPTKEPNIFHNPETSTSANLDVDKIPSSLPVSSSSIKPEILIESTSGKLIESTTQFDWNNYFPEANRASENPDGIGLIDVRIGSIEPV